jgi:hypothetical protein
MKLCYKEYQIKDTIGARRQFYERTGMDLPRTCMLLLQSFSDTRDLPVRSRLSEVIGIISFFKAAEFLHALIQAKDDSIPLVEVLDAMHKVGHEPTEREGEMGEPWTYLLISVASELCISFREDVKKK